MTMIRDNAQKIYRPISNQSMLAHFFIYENKNFLCDSKITKEHITIGRSQEADVVLNHSTVADIHAFVHFEGPQAFLTNRYPNNGLRLNGRSIRLAKLNDEDIIHIGPFALKVKVGEKERAAIGADQKSHSVVLINRYANEVELQTAIEKAAKLFRVTPAQMAPVFAKPEYVLKRDLGEFEAKRFEIALTKAGIWCEIRSSTSENIQPLSVQPITPRSDEKRAKTGDNALSKKAFERFIPDEDEDEDDEWQATFSLKQRLAKIGVAGTTALRRPSHLQVVKTRGEQVVDVQFLGKGRHYSIPTDRGNHCLVRNKGNDQDYVYFADDYSGYINNARGETSADLDSYKTSDYLFKKRKRLYRIEVPETGELVVSEGQNQYHIFRAPVSSRPSVRVAKRPSSFSLKHWAVSAATHLVLALCLSVYWYFQVTAQQPSEPHFVKIDPALLQQLQALKKPEPPKKQPPPKPEPQKVAEKVKPAKKAPKKKRPAKLAKPVKSKKKTRRVAKAAPSRHPKAGGGFGEGNIKNRNINQAGLLSALGQAPTSGQSATIASVTNLDAVAVPGATDSHFTVGGVKGSLGNGKIAVAQGEMLQTKGSKQVFRSAGASGPGHVAALQKGSTGKKQVQAMVTAKMSRTVKIQGGMSRAMVKRVIDRHLEEITYCYETALMSNPTIMGRIVFEWKILMSGRVGQVRIVASSVNSHEVHNCIKSAIQSWQFPKPVGNEVVVSYPFVFDLVAF